MGSATPDTDLDYETSVMANLRAGWALTDVVTVGLESSGRYKQIDDVDFTFSVVTAGATFYPGNMGLFVKGGVGSGTLEVSTSTGSGTLAASDTGFGLLVGLGYERRLTTKFALGIEGNYAYMNISELSGTNFLGAHVIFNWYWQKKTEG